MFWLGAIPHRTDDDTAKSLPIVRANIVLVTIIVTAMIVAMVVVMVMIVVVMIVVVIVVLVVVVVFVFVFVTNLDQVREVQLAK